LGVVDDGDLEERAFRAGGFGQLADVGEVVDQLWRDASAVVADDECLAEVEVEDARRVDSRVEAGDDE
jgi:hypothetical protein